MKGIIFSEPMFNSVINGIKTQTRMILKSQPTGVVNSWDLTPLSIHPEYDNLLGSFYYRSDDGFEYIHPRYKVGEKVYLKEPYFIDDNRVIYRFDNYKDDHLICKWENNMPEKYARYWIEIEAVRCERLQDISEEDFLKEGIVRLGSEHYYNGFQSGDLDKNDNYFPYSSPQISYAAFIDKINGKGTWESNPFVWVNSFKLINN